MTIKFLLERKLVFICFCFLSQALGWDGFILEKCLVLVVIG